MSYAPLSESQAVQLARIECSVDGPLSYAPCRVTLRSGEVLDRVYLVEARAYLSTWGIDPKEDPRKQWVAIEDVEVIEDSPVRLSAGLATQVYAAGESGMGYTIFTVEDRDGRQLPFTGGNAVDFPDWPSGFDPMTVVAVHPHVGREHSLHRGSQPGKQIAPYRWCLYSGGGMAS